MNKSIVSLATSTELSYMLLLIFFLTTIPFSSGQSSDSELLLGSVHNFLFPVFVWQKLLQDNGFKPKEQICIKRSSDPNWLSTSLTVMHRIARIIKMDEVTSQSSFFISYCTSLKSHRIYRTPISQIYCRTKQSLLFCET